MLKSLMSYKTARRTTKNKILQKNPCASDIFVQRRQMSPLLSETSLAKKFFIKLAAVLLFGVFEEDIQR